MNEGHGHVIPREDGAKARCGGPFICHVCANELGQKNADAGNILNNQLCSGLQGYNQTASAIDWQKKTMRDMSIMRSQQILREKGRVLNFDELLAEIYLSGLTDHFNGASKNERR